MVEKSGRAWSETFENRNKRNAFLRFILKENGFKTKNWEQNAKRSVFRNFTCIRKSKKRAWSCGGVSQTNFYLKFFSVVIEVLEQLIG